MKLRCTLLDDTKVTYHSWDELTNNVKKLDCSNNQLTFLPESIVNLTQLKRFDCGINKLLSLPGSIGNLTQLQRFDCGINKLISLPESIGNLTQLQQLYLYDNQLTTIPIQLILCTQLSKFIYYGNPIEFIPTPIRRMMNGRVRNYRNNGIYQDSQNVHSSSIQKSLQKSIFNLLNDPNDITDEQLKVLIVETNEINDQTKSILFEYMAIGDEHSTIGITFTDLLKKVILRIDKNPDLYQRLNEEMMDSECKCFTGRLTRLVNVLVGFCEDIRIEIGCAEQISNVISLVRERHQLDDSDELTDEAKEEIRVELLGRGYELSVINEWLI
jgi:hypothetical protein